MGKLFSPPSRGRSREKPIFMRFSRKYLIFGSDSEPFSRLSGSWLRFGAIFRLWHQNWCRFLDWNFCVGIKIDAILITSSLIPSKSSHLARVIFKNLSPLLIPSGKGRFLSGFQKISAHFNPYLRVALLTYPPRISPTIPYSNFCGWKTTRFLKKFPHNPIPQLSELKNDIFPETFSKNVLTPLPHVFEAKTVMLSHKVSHSYTASFFGQI